MAGQHRIQPHDAPIPAGWEPLVKLQFSDGTVESPHRACTPAMPRTADELAAAIRTNMARGLPTLSGRIRPDGYRTMILACYGPSLKNTWPDIQREEGDLWTVSGAHAFLVERGLSPIGHTDVDPRAHKVRLLSGLTCPLTTFYLPSRIAPVAHDHLGGRRIIQYHLDIKNEKDVIRAVDPDAFLVPPAITAGLTAVQLGLTLGYRHFIIHGMDCSHAGDGTGTHAGWHPNPATQSSIVEVAGRQFFTEMLLLQAVEDFFAIAVEWPLGTFEFRGGGLLPWVEQVARGTVNIPPPAGSK